MRRRAYLHADSRGPLAGNANQGRLLVRRNKAGISKT